MGLGCGGYCNNLRKFLTFHISSFEQEIKFPFSGKFYPRYSVFVVIKPRAIKFVFRTITTTESHGNYLIFIHKRHMTRRCKT